MQHPLARGTIAVVLLAVISTVLIGSGSAQSPTDLRGIPDLGGTWLLATEREVACPDDLDARGLPRLACRFPVDELQLNARALAWIEFVDEPIEGKFYCIPESIPSLLVRRYPLRIQQRADRVILEHEVFLSANVTRYVWTDGRPHPPPADVEYYGHSTGRYEDDSLVVVTKNFTFDPNGIDYQAQVPSSWLKVLTERYTRLDANRLRLELTIEDPVFLKQRYTETVELARAEDPEIEWVDCDLETAGQPLMMLPPKYED